MGLLQQDWLYVAITGVGFVALYRAVRSLSRRRFAFLLAAGQLLFGATAIAIGASRVLGLTEPMTILTYQLGLGWDLARITLLAAVGVGAVSIWLDS